MAENQVTLSVDTSVISYCTAKGSKDTLKTYRINLTKDWWSKHRHNFDLFISDFVIQEISRGDSVIAQERLKFVQNIPFLEATEEVFLLAKELVQNNAYPKKAEFDALHISVASINEMTYLLSWNCTHIVNANILPKTKDIIEQNGYTCPLVYTPEQFILGA